MLAVRRTSVTHWAPWSPTDVARSKAVAAPADRLSGTPPSFFDVGLIITCRIAAWYACMAELTSSGSVETGWMTAVRNRPSMGATAGGWTPARSWNSSMRRARVSSSIPVRTSARNVARSRLDTRWTSCSRASGTATVAALANGRRPTKVGCRSWSSPELFTSLSSSVIVRPEPSGPEARFESDGWRTRLVANRATRSASAPSFGTSAGRWNRKAVFTEAAGSTTSQRAGAAEPPGYS